jgi:hypothetical protein
MKPRSGIALEVFMTSLDHDRAIPPIEELKSKKTIIAGEVNTGKTALLGHLLKIFMDQGETRLAVIDMAPESTRGIGGKLLLDEALPLRYYTTQIVPPRLTGKSEEEVLMYAENNARLLEHIFLLYLEEPAQVLFINDVSIYLQAGDPEKLLSVLVSTPTTVMNGYYGSSLGGGSLGERERRNMTELLRLCDKVIEM